MATKTVYQVENPDTGATEFIEKGGKLYAWATYCRKHDGEYIHLGWSNAATEAAAIRSARASFPCATEYAAAPARIVTAAERDAHLKSIEDAAAAALDAREAEDRAAMASAALQSEVAKIRANRDAEEEARAAARRARNRTNYAPAPEPTVDDKAATAAAERPVGQVYQVTNPLTGAIEFPIKVMPSRRLVGWAGYYRDAFGRAQHLGWSNADTEAAALAEITAFNPTGTDYAVAPAKPVTLGECKAYLDRRAALAPTDAKRAKWARILTNAAIDYLRTEYDTDDSRTAKAHLASLADTAVQSLGDKWEVQRMHVDWQGRVTTRAENAARMFLIVERDLDNHPRPEAVEHRLTQYLERRDDLIHELEVATSW